MVANFKAIAKSYEYDNILEQLEHNDEFFQARTLERRGTKKEK